MNDFAEPTTWVYSALVLSLPRLSPFMPLVVEKRGLLLHVLGLESYPSVNQI